uniref:Integrase core domain containing protein n=1 Tax=Solanum tuberosum TaxID=4113 RepID=M1DC52_SOLTU
MQTHSCPPSEIENVKKCTIYFGDLRSKIRSAEAHYAESIGFAKLTFMFGIHSGSFGELQLQLAIHRTHSAMLVATILQPIKGGCKKRMDIRSKLVQPSPTQAPTSRVLPILPPRSLNRLKAAGEHTILEEKWIFIDNVLSDYPAIWDIIRFHCFEGFTRLQNPYVLSWARADLRFIPSPYYPAFKKVGVPFREKSDVQVTPPSSNDIRQIKSDYLWDEVNRRNPPPPDTTLLVYLAAWDFEATTSTPSMEQESISSAVPPTPATTVTVVVIPTTIPTPCQP